MLRFFRLLIIVLLPIAFCGAWYVAPQLLEAESLRWLSGVVAILWALELGFYKKLEDVGSVQGISTKEHELLLLRLLSLRKRVWWVGGVGLACSLVIWLLTALKLPGTSPLYASMVGGLLGISLSYLILIPSWLNESQAFIDETKRQDAIRRKRADIQAASKK